MSAVNSKIDWDAVRSDFPILQQQVRGKRLAYLDNAATTQKPQCVIDALVDYYQGYNSNVHRGVHALSEQATAGYEGARQTVADYLNAASVQEIVFTSGTTDAINLVAQTWGVQNITAGDAIVISAVEHHSNIVPWQMLCEQVGAELRVIPVSAHVELDLTVLDELLDSQVKLVAMGHVSNAFGSIHNVEHVIKKARAVGAKILLDGAQAVAHMNVDVQQLDVDFYAFSGHKIYGPTGIGALYAKQDLLESMPPWKGGGEMIKTVSFDSVEYNELPYKFEAGTPNIADAIGLAAAIKYLSRVGVIAAAQRELELLRFAEQAVADIDGLTIVGQAVEKAAILSFVIDGINTADLGALLDQQGVAIRSGHHCVMPGMTTMGLNGTARASISMYNNVTDIEQFAKALHVSIRMLK